MTANPNFLQLLSTRRSVRRYRDAPVDPDIIALLEEAILRCPSSHNRKSWEFVVVDEVERLEALSRAKPQGSRFLAQARLAFVVCGDPQRSDVWIEDCAIAAHTVHLAAHALGLGSCWIQIRRRPHDAQVTAEDYVRRILDLPDSLRVLCMVAIGWPEKEPAGHPTETLPFDRLHRNRM